MTWAAALVVAAAIGGLAPPPLRARAFAAGWFERAGETDRPRSARRPTHGGAVAGVAVLVAAVLAGPAEPVARAALAGVGIALLTGVRSERHLRPRSLRWGRVGAAVAVPVAGARMELTGNDVTDVVLVALLALAVIEGLARLQSSDGTMVLVAGVVGAGTLVAAVRVDDTPGATVAAGLAAVALALSAHALPPGVLLLGRSGPGVLGAATVAAAVAHEPGVGQPTGALVPLLLCAVPLAALAVPGLDQRLGARRVPPAPALGGAALVAVAAAVLLDGGDLPAVAAVAVGLLPVATLAAVGVALGRPAAAPPRPGWLTPALLAAGVAVAAMAGYAGTSAASARADVYAGRDHAERGLAAARDGELDAARAEFEAAEERFASADRRLSSPLLRVAEVTVPGVAQNLRAAGALIASGSDLAGTAVAVAERAGADDLRVVDGRVPIEAAAEVGSELARAREVLGDTQARLVDIDSDWLVDEAREATAALAEQVAEADASIEVAAETTRLLPSLLGGDRERRWFVAVLSSSELRGAGGLLGNYAVLTAAGGAVDLERTGGAAELNASTEGAADVLPAVFAQQYASWSPERFWQNLSVTPDFPTMAEAVRALAPRSVAGVVDGVVGIDPLGLEALVELTGPVQVPSWPEPLDARNIAEVLLFEQYRAFPDDAQVDEFQSDVVGAVVDALTEGELPAPSELIATLAPAVAGGHLRLFSAEADEQALFERIGADGALRQPPASDFFQLVTQNGSEAKIDHFLRREVDYAMAIDPATGDATATVTVTLTNLAPAEGLPAYIIGGRDGTAVTTAGEMRCFTTVVTPLAVTSVQVDGGPERPVQLGSEQGMLTGTVLHRIPAGGTATLVFRLDGRFDPLAGYRLAVGRQPTAHADAVTVRFAGQTSRFEQVAPRTVAFEGGEPAPG